MNPCIAWKAAWWHRAMLVMVGMGVIWSLVSGGLGGGAKSVYAQGTGPPLSPVSLAVINTGYDGHYRKGHWFPITVELRNDGPDVHATLIWHFPGYANHSFQRETDLPRGAHKRLTLYAYTTETTRIGEIRLSLDKLAPLREHQQQVTIEPIEQDWFVIGVLSSNATLLNSLLAMNIPNTWKTIVLHLAPENLPINAQAMHGIDALFFHDIASNRLNAEQYDALEEWVWLGGQLVVGGGSNADLSTTRLTDLLPVTIHQLEANVSLEPLRQLIAETMSNTGDTSDANDTGENTNEELFPEATTAHRITLKEGAVAFDTEQLITTQRWGHGRVMFTRFDLNVLRSWSGEANLWEHILMKVGFLNPYENLDLWNMVKFPAMDILPFGLLLLFITGYIIIVGPLNFLLLRKYQRVDLAWFTTPAIAIVFIAGTYGIGLFGRGISTQVFHLAIVQAEEGKSMGVESAYYGIFSPHRTNYSLTLPGPVLIYPENPFSYQMSSSGKRTVVWDDASSSVQDVLIDVGSMRTILLEHRVPNTLSVSSSLRWSESQDNTKQLVGNIENTGTTPLTESILVYGDQSRQIGTIGPGERLAVSLGPNDNGFPYTVMGMSDDDELFSRQYLISQAFSPAPVDVGMTFTSPAPVIPFTASMQMSQRPYLLAWGNQPLTTPQIGGGKPVQEQRTLVLYIILLNPI